MTLSPPADPVSEAWAKGLEVGDEVVAATKQGWWYATMGGGVEDSDEVWVQDDAVWVVRDLHLTPAPRSIRTLGRRRQDTMVQIDTGTRYVWIRFAHGPERKQQASRARCTIAPQQHADWPLTDARQGGLADAHARADDASRSDHRL